ANSAFFFDGHVTASDGAGRVVGIGDHTNRVYQMLANYQAYTNGRNSFLRIVEFNPAIDGFSVKSFAPSTGEYLTSSKQQFGYTNISIFRTNALYQIDPANGSASLNILPADLT